MVQKAQARRAEANERRARVGHIPRELQVGERVLLRRPPPHLRDDPVSRRLQSKADFSVYQVIKKVGDSNYVLGDPTTGLEIKSFAQPVHADRLVPLEVEELAEPISTKTFLEIDGLKGIVTRQSMDGRVLVELADEEAELNFAWDQRKQGASKHQAGRGVRVNLQSHDHQWL